MVSSSERDAALQLAEARSKRLAQSLQESEAEVSSLLGRLQASVSPSTHIALVIYLDTRFCLEASVIK